MSEKFPNRPTPEGIEAGKYLARMTDTAEKEQLKQFPNQDKRCKSCAYLEGTVPNGCVPTVMDAIKAACERVPFMCHQHFDANGNPTEICMGWVILQSASKLDKSIKMPWEFSE